jgi:alanine racemase
MRHDPLASTAGFGATLTIDLGAIAANWRTLAARAKDGAGGAEGGAECGAVIKADAYGCGIAAVAPALAKAGCRTFFVAHLAEGRAARAALGPEPTIYVLNGLLPGSAALYAADRLTPVLGAPAEVGEWRDAGGGAFALHVDTGMNRLGMSLDEAAALKRAGLAAEAGLVLTHFSASEDHADPANARQISAFADVAALFPDTRRSLWNSSGHFLPGARAYELTRPGYALYGGNPTPGQPNPMREVVRLTATILQVREVPDGAGVGYNSRWHAKGPRRLATICLGYADGYPRNGSNTDTTAGGSALVGGVPCPFAGTVSMDLIIVDVTDAPAGAAERGAPVTLIGDALDIDTVGAAAKTIGYEVLTSLGRRYQRVYR